MFMGSKKDLVLTSGPQVQLLEEVDLGEPGFCRRDLGPLLFTLRLPRHALESGQRDPLPLTGGCPGSGRPSA
jgi:hypothetical protein